MLLSPAFFLFLFHGWAYALSNWFYSLPVCLIFTGVYYAIVNSLNTANATDIWLYRFLPAIIAWAANVLFTQGIMRYNGIRVTGIKGNESYPFDVIREAILVSLTCFFVIYDIIIPNILMFWIVFIFFIFVFYSMAHSHWRFETNTDVLSYYSNWFYMGTFSVIVYVVGAIFLPANDQADIGYFYLSIGVAITQWIFVLITAFFQRK